MLAVAHFFLSSASFALHPASPAIFHQLNVRFSTTFAPQLRSSSSTTSLRNSWAPGVASTLATRLAEYDITLLDASVSGGDAGPIAGTLSIMVGGDEETFKRCMPIFQAMGKTIVHVGGVEQARCSRPVIRSWLPW